MLTITSLTVNHLTDAVGLDEPLGFSWTFQSQRRGALQTAYRLQIARQKSFVNPIFDSGLVPSGESQNRPAEGFSPAAAEAYFVRVKVQSSLGVASAWSSPVRFSTGMMGSQRAAMITAEDPPCPDRSCGTYVRGSFKIKGRVRSAWLFTSALGLYVPFLNGTRVGADQLAPGWTSYHKHLLYQANEVTSLLRQGENVAGAMLGAGWFKGKMGFLLKRNNYGRQTAFFFQLVVRYSDGRVQTVLSDASWQGCESPVVFSEIYDGEIYDARLEQENWCQPEANLSLWHPVKIVPADLACLTAQPGCRIRCQNILPAAKMFVTPSGKRVIDFGQNLTGFPEFVLRGRKDQTYRMRCFEALDAKGDVYLENLRTAKQAVSYTCRKDGAIVHRPMFTFYGFRYLWLEDWPQDAVPEDFCAYAVHSHMRPTGDFSCSSVLINQLHHNILWSMKGNFLDVPTDCPQRDERMGWTGDAQIFCATATKLMDVYTFYRKWLADVRADQTAEGGVPHVVPDIITPHAATLTDWLLRQGTHSAAGWADAIILCPWRLYLAYGDAQILQENYDAMRAWIAFMRAHATNNIWNYRLQFGDWVALDAAQGSYFGATPNDLACTAYYAHSVSILAKVAGILGKSDDADNYTALHRAIADTFEHTFFTQTGEMTAKTQTAHILALQFGLVPPRWKEKTVQSLLRLLQENGGHLSTGFMGTPFLLPSLAKGGHPEAAYNLLLQEDYPSWLYQVKMGATTVWEHWDGMRPDGSMWSPEMNSFNHYAYGSVGDWFYSGILGIEADETAPGFRHSVLCPCITPCLQWAQGALETCYGRLAVSWAWEGKTVCIRIEIPANTTATLILRNASAIKAADGIRFQRTGEGLEALIPSGRYVIQYQ